MVVRAEKARVRIACPMRCALRAFDSSHRVPHMTARSDGTRSLRVVTGGQEVLSNFALLGVVERSAARDALLVCNAASPTTRRGDWEMTKVRRRNSGAFAQTGPGNLEFREI